VVVIRNMKQEGGTFQSFERLLGKATRAEFVTGIGLVRVSAARAHEIPKVIIEHHKFEAERARAIAYMPRVV
jgi:hypothetical protein